MRYGMCFAIVLGHLQRGEHAQAAERARQVFQANPNWSYAHVMLAATQARLGHFDAAHEAASRALELEPGFTITGMCAAAAYPPSLAQPLSEALRLAGMPE
jgi:hypothetical protein